MAGDFLNNIRQWNRPVLNLCDFDLQSKDMNDIVRSVNENTKIQSLGLTHNRLDAHCLDSLANLKNISMINLAHNDIDDSNTAGLKKLLANSQLKTIILDCNNLEEPAIQILENQNDDKYISFQHNPGNTKNMRPS